MYLRHVVMLVRVRLTSVVSPTRTQLWEVCASPWKSPTRTAAVRPFGVLAPIITLVSLRDEQGFGTPRHQSRSMM
jgi:hypothetical protein